MKLTCQQTHFLEALALLAKAIPRRQYNDVRFASSLRLAAFSGTLELYSTDAESGLRCEIAAQVEEDGLTTLPLKVLSEVIGSWKPGLVSIESMPGTPFDLILQSDAARSKSLLKGMDPEAYPAFPAFATAERPPLILDARQLKQMIAQVAFAAAEEAGARPVFTFVLLELGSDTIQFVAADDARLALSSCPLAGGTNESVLVRASALERLSAILPNAGAVELVVGEGHLQASCENWAFWTQLGVGTYLDYQRVIPQEAQTRVVLPTAEFAEAVKSIVPFARQDSQKAFLSVDLQANAVVLSAEAADLGRNTCVVDATVCEGMNVEMIFNYKGLQSLLPAIDAKRVILELNGPRRPGKITIDPTSGGSTTFTYILAPLAPTK